MVGLVNWVMLHVSKYIGIETCEVSLVPFKLTDDDTLRQALLQMVGTGQAAPSDLYESFGMDYAKVLEKQKEDAILKATSDVETKFVVEQAMFLASKNVVDRFDKDNDYRSALSKAQAVAQQLYQADPMARLSVLDSFQVTDYPMYVLVSHLLTTFDEQQAGAGMQDPNAPPGQESQGGQEGQQEQGNQAPGGGGAGGPSSASGESKPKQESKPDNK
jgi:ribosomal protein S13